MPRAEERTLFKLLESRLVFMSYGLEGHGITSPKVYGRNISLSLFLTKYPRKIKTSSNFNMPQQGHNNEIARIT